jgi:hypothetical protein
MSGMLKMQERRIPRWLVESDPSWEKSIDSELGILKWNKKGTQVQAVCSPAGMVCEIVGDQEGSAGLADFAAVGMSRLGRQAALSAAGVGDITKYLSSRYLNPGVNGPPRFDLKKMSKP